MLKGEGKNLSPSEMTDLYASLCDRFPIVSIEDGHAEDDWEGWSDITERIGDKIQLVGDDLFVTNVERLKLGIERERRQLDPDQAEPDRHPDRDARLHRAGHARTATRP